MADRGMIKICAVGSRNTEPWDEVGKFRIVQIFISHGEEINSLQFQYSEEGLLVLSQRYGTNSGYKFDAVRLEHPVEYITWISGHKRYGNNHLCALTFGTNLGEYGPFGSSSVHDQEFVFRLGVERQFGGFHGSSDVNGVKSIGVYLKPITSLPDETNPKDSWELLDES